VASELGSRVEQEKQAVGAAAAELVEDGMTVGLGSGSTVACLIKSLAARRPSAQYVATSPAIEELARAAGLELVPFVDLGGLDLAIDGADQVAPDIWLVKGGGGAHTREKVVAAAAARFVVIVSSDKLVESIRVPVPLELLPFGLAATLRGIAPTSVRETKRTPDGNVLADYLGNVNDPASVAHWLASKPGVVEHGLFEPELVHSVLVARGGTVEELAGAAQAGR
jgi:ribose 5-phosphate isomerase A